MLMLDIQQTSDIINYLQLLNISSEPQAAARLCKASPSHKDTHPLVAFSIPVKLKQISQHWFLITLSLSVAIPSCLSPRTYRDNNMAEGYSIQESQLHYPPTSHHITSHHIKRPAGG
jgi:hypothetical protein